MSLISKPFTFSAGAVVIASQHNSNFDTVYNLVNGALDATNLAANAAIADTQLGQITTAGKVSGAALTSFTSIPSGAGVIPIANLASGTPNGTKFVRDDGTLQVPNNTAATALSGSIVQSLSVQIVGTTGTTVVPWDNTIPQSAEGDQYGTLTITPNNASNLLEFDGAIQCTHSDNTSAIIVAIFQDSTASAIYASVGQSATTAAGTSIPISFRMTAGTTSATTFKVRVGGGNTGTTTVYGTGSAKLGGVLISNLLIKEVKA